MSDIKLIVKIPKEMYRHIMSMQFYIPGTRNGKSLLENILKAIRTATPLPIPKGATNGDMIKVMFPKAIDKKVKPTNKVHFMDDFKGELYGIGVISLEWWNAPYNAESKGQEDENESGLKMSIDRSKRILIDRYIDTYVVCGGVKANSNYTPAINITGEDYEAFKVAIGIMRKYQEIQEIVTEWQKQNDPKIRFAASNSSMKKITEVLDGNDKKTKSSDEP